MNRAVAFERLTTVAAPRIATNSTELLRVLMDPDRDSREVFNAIKNHAVIVGRLISLANSAWSKPVHPVTSPEEAYVRIGEDVTRTVAVALAVVHSFAVTQCASFNPERHWMSSIITSQISSSLAKTLGTDAATARTAGLLHNIGLLWLAEQFPVETDATLSAENGVGIGVDERLEAACGIGYREAGRILMSRWSFPSDLLVTLGTVEEQSLGTESNQMRRVVRTAAELSSLVLSDSGELSNDVALAGVDPAEIQALLQTHRAMLEKTETMAALLANA